MNALIPCGCGEEVEVWTSELAGLYGEKQTIYMVACVECDERTNERMTWSTTRAGAVYDWSRMRRSQEQGSWSHVEAVRCQVMLDEASLLISQVQEVYEPEHLEETYEQIGEGIQTIREFIEPDRVRDEETR